VDALDVVLLLILLLAALHGLRLGAAVQVLSFGGMIAGLGIGVGLVVAICPHVSGEHPKTFVALVLLLVPAAVLSSVGRHVGARLWRRLRQARFGAVDALGGAMIAVVGSLVVVWFLASLLVNSQLSLVGNEIQNSRIICGVAKVMPPIPTAIAPVEQFLAQEGLPQAFVNEPCLGGGTVPLPGKVALSRAVRTAGPSTVKVEAVGCDEVQEGSGFVVAPGLVVTNAHVIAGTRDVMVLQGGRDYTANVVYFDPRFDLAVLHVPGLRAPSLVIDAGLVPAGTEAVVLGYPGGGPFTAVPAGVISPLEATGLDIYGDATTVREVYELRAMVRPGNSGGPLVEPDGLVIGVVFSRSSSLNNVGFALATPGVLTRVREAESRPAALSVGTGQCISS
jgi:S1-C subfamily serine protease